MRISISAVSFENLEAVSSTARQLLDILYRLRALGSAERPDYTALGIHTFPFSIGEGRFVRFIVNIPTGETAPRFLNEGPNSIEAPVPKGTNARGFAAVVMATLYNLITVASQNRWRQTASWGAAGGDCYVFNYSFNPSEL